MTDFTYERQDAEVYWTDGRFAENFLAGMGCGVESRHTFRDRDGVYGPCEGFVYFIAIGAPYVTHIKIGFTTGNPLSRLASLQTGCPFEMQLLGFVLGTRDQEAELHSVLQGYRVRGEWFEFTDYVRDTVRHQLEGRVFA